MGLVITGEFRGAAEFKRKDGSIQLTALIQDGIDTWKVALREGSRVPDVGDLVEIPIRAAAKDKAPIYYNEA